MRKRFNEAEALDYWRSHTLERAPLKLAEDPEALENTTHPTFPLEVNRYHVDRQSEAFEALMGRVGAARPGARALDVGCGAARWGRKLMAAGYEVTGIDLQAELIALNRQRYPEATFVCESLQDYLAPPASFDLLTSVTVIQHNPFDVQASLARKMRALLVDGGHAIVLENIKDQGHHMFARSIRGWKRLFQDVGFRCLKHAAYDYAWHMRSYLMGNRIISRLMYEIGATPLPVQHGLLKLAARLDARVEPVASRAAPGPFASHCAYLFQAS
jgi:2-polyprenyl-3-methyl-5-hydroxy-6-metoxy-1,4-benzoquinol methylase